TFCKLLANRSRIASPHAFSGKVLRPISEKVCDDDPKFSCQDAVFCFQLRAEFLEHVNFRKPVFTAVCKPWCALPMYENIRGGGGVRGCSGRWTARTTGSATRGDAARCG